MGLHVTFNCVYFSNKFGDTQLFFYQMFCHKVSNIHDDLKKNSVEFFFIIKCRRIMPGGKRRYFNLVFLSKKCRDVDNLIASVKPGFHILFRPIGVFIDFTLANARRFYLSMSTSGSEEDMIVRIVSIVSKMLKRSGRRSKRLGVSI